MGSGSTGEYDDWGNNIHADPLFFDPTNGDFHLQSTSPCIDVGDNGAWNLPTTDFEGDDRIIDGDGDGTAVVDMGADEYKPQQAATTVPTLNRWGMILFILLAGLSAVYYLRRRAAQ
ncbi:MAG: IPTL-CTERM sorting domain-containing protein [Nitrospirae bacterium]|nr:MAG: IPTL-CTERM sorting domain-containing protein [Nitrospirota bacterium]